MATLCLAAILIVTLCTLSLSIEKEKRTRQRSAEAVAAPSASFSSQFCLRSIVLASAGSHSPPRCSRAWTAFLLMTLCLPANHRPTSYLSLSLDLLPVSALVCFVAPLLFRLLLLCFDGATTPRSRLALPAVGSSLKTRTASNLNAHQLFSQPSPSSTSPTWSASFSASPPSPSATSTPHLVCATNSMSEIIPFGKMRLRSTETP